MSEAQYRIVTREAKVMELRPEVGFVIPIYGRERSSAYALERMGIARLFSLAPYDPWFIQLTEVSNRVVGPETNNFPKEAKMAQTLIDVKNATTADLVAFYNEHAEKEIKKFSTRAVAEKRVTELAEALENDAQEVDTFGAEEKKGSKKAASKKTTKKAKGEKRTLSEAIAESWKVPETHAKRCERSAVKVGKQQYKSVRAAFVELGLPINEHIRFRMKLKAEGKIKAYNTTWTIIPLNYGE